jgi:dolichol-phosphate mannosyltransferase
MISIIVPTYKEAKNISILSNLIHSILLEKNEFEIIFVDDDSNDGTVKICTQLSEIMPVKLLVRKKYRGLASAVIEGIGIAEGDILVVLDADLSHPPSAIPEMVELLKSGEADFVVGSRYKKGGSIDKNWSFFRYLNSRTAIFLALPLIKLTDPMSGFFALRKVDMPDTTLLNPIGYKIGLEILVKSCFKRIMEVPIHFSERRFGTSKFSLKEQLLYIGHLIRLYNFRYPLLAKLTQFETAGAIKLYKFFAHLKNDTHL